jgi:uncharacterized membrane protein (DUF106 family)
MFLPYQEVLVWALVISFILSVVYRIFTDPKKMRQIKEDMKFYRDKSNKARKSKDTKKMGEYSSEMLKLSQKQMKSTMKPMFVSMAIILLILGYVNSAYSGVLVELEGDDTSGTGTFAYRDYEYPLMAERYGDVIEVKVDTDNNGNFGDETPYVAGDLVYLEDTHWAVSPGEDLKTVKMDLAVKLPFTMPILGWTYLNWLFWYVLCTLPATFLFRKALGVE